jgi:hypothetical protein
MDTFLIGREKLGLERCHGGRSLPQRGDERDSGGVIALFPRPTLPVVHAERLSSEALRCWVEVSTPGIADGRHPSPHSTRSPAGPE